MTDYGRALQFGVVITPSSTQLDNSYALAELADETLECIGVQHYPVRQVAGWPLRPWTRLLDVSGEGGTEGHKFEARCS